MSETFEAEVIAPVETKGGLVTYLNIDGAMTAAAFYKKAFGATLATQHPVDGQGRTTHVHLYVNGASLMLGDFYPEHGFAPEKPAAFSLTLIVTGIEAWFSRAVEAGCTVVTPPQKMFWGDTYAQVTDPFGILWGMNQAA